jgi:hypothetical protein
MSKKDYPIESLLRPVLEIPVAIIGFSIGISIVIWHNIFLLEQSLCLKINSFYSLVFFWVIGCKTVI